MCKRVRGERDASSIFRFNFTFPTRNLNIVNLSAATGQVVFHKEAEQFSHRVKAVSTHLQMCARRKKMKTGFFAFCVRYMSSFEREERKENERKREEHESAAVTQRES